MPNPHVLVGLTMYLVSLTNAKDTMHTSPTYLPTPFTGTLSSSPIDIYWFYFEGLCRSNLVINTKPLVNSIFSNYTNIPLPEQTLNLFDSKFMPSDNSDMTILLYLVSAPIVFPNMVISEMNQVYCCLEGSGGTLYFSLMCQVLLSLLSEIEQQ